MSSFWGYSNFTIAIVDLMVVILFSLCSLGPKKTVEIMLEHFKWWSKHEEKKRGEMERKGEESVRGATGTSDN